MTHADLNDLARRVARTLPEDDAGRSALLGEIEGLRKSWEGGSRRDLAGCLEAAAVLLARLNGLPRAGACEVLQIVSRLICVSAQSFPQSLEGAEETVNEAAPAPAEESLGEGLLGEVQLGEILVRLRHVSVHDVERALIHQRESGQKLGQALISIGATGHEQVQEALRIQRKMRLAGGTRRTLELRTRGAQANDAERSTDLRLVSDTYLGEILVRQGFVTQRQVEEAILVQRATGIRIGEALVQTGLTTWSRVEEALRIQNELRSPPPAVPADVHRALP